MRFMGLDYGMKRIGTAVSDESGQMAFPKKIILNDSNVFKNIADIIKNFSVEEIVIGESMDLKNQPNALSAQIEVFIAELEKRLKLPVHKQKEFLTTIEARRGVNAKSDRDVSATHRTQKGRAQSADASAAALILQRYLDKINTKKNS